ncbi:hypothetical protein MTBUT4_520009 [Magnetospirillum sp. UT-4]|nr:hypothetical protein MTBUT4_520009 [Magnetospirillum sp. UT-4]
MVGAGASEGKRADWLSRRTLTPFGPHPEEPRQRRLEGPGPSHGLGPPRASRRPPAGASSA